MMIMVHGFHILKASLLCRTTCCRLLNIVDVANIKKERTKSKDSAQKDAFSMATVTSKFAIYSKLSKRNLSVLVTSTALWGYYMNPAGISHPIIQALGLTVGTMLTACSANSFNQLFEMPYDAQMERTKQRVLIQGKHISPFHAWNFGIITGMVGVVVLGLTTSYATCLLGLFNIVLYSWVYTKTKRTSHLNTMIGSVVGAIPPLMGWLAVSDGYVSISGGIALSALVYMWQFPHFNSLSWQLRSENREVRAGYSMNCVSNPFQCRLLTAIHAIGLIPLCGIVFPACKLTTGYFIADSIVFNLLLTHFALAFAISPSKHSANSLFIGSLYYLPTIMILSLLNSHFSV